MKTLLHSDKKKCQSTTVGRTDVTGEFSYKSVSTYQEFIA